MCQPANEEVVSIIESRLATIAKGSEVEIGFFGGNFTGIDTGLQENYLSLAQDFINKGVVRSIRLSTRPDYIDNSTLKLLKRYGVRTIELGAQSLDDEVLIKSGRGHTSMDVINASRLILESGFELGLQMMIGLPGDSLEKCLATARMIVSLGASNTRIYPTLVIKDTALEALYNSGGYQVLTLPEAVEWTKEVVKIFEAGNVRILRMGLHPSEGLLNGESLVAGPFHVSFGELVLSSLWEEELATILKEEVNACEALKQVNAVPGNHREKRLIVEVPPGQVNAAVGHKGSNKAMLSGAFKEVKFRENSMLAGRKFKALVELI